MRRIGCKLETSILARFLKSKSPFLYRICGEKWDQLRNLWARVVRLCWRLSRSEISESARVHPSAYISSYKVKIGAGCLIGPHTVIYENSILEDSVELGPGCVVGSEGFVCHALGRKVIPIIHVGGVYIHRGARIQSLSCIDKSTEGGYTEIGEESRISGHVHIGHNVKLGRRCHVESHASLGGHVVYGDDVWICMNASIVELLIIGNSVRIGPSAVVTKNVEDSKSVSGNFAIDSKRHRDFVRSAAEGRLGLLLT
jgi:UDP-3-O-[3-hydroxymyristoyl] glucosamine N-acyltransferase